jgi:hypothetical protein
MSLESLEDDLSNGSVFNPFRLTVLIQKKITKQDLNMLRKII